MAEKKVLMIVKVDTVWSSLEEFNEQWGRVNLPFWEENGAKHIGSFINYLGSNKNQIIRLFEFESRDHWHKFMELREKMFNSEEGRQSLGNTVKFIERLEESVWLSVYK
jgi:hypothetical protein